MRRPPDLMPLPVAAQALLRQHGPLDLADLADLLQEDGFDLTDDPEGFLDDALIRGQPR